jgi:short-subunit dehydrogenase
MTRRLCLITGASSGIGSAFAKVYARQGYDVALTARRADRLEALADTLRLRYAVETLVLPGDLADPATPDRLLAEIAAHGRQVDALVNNAGYALKGPFGQPAWAEHQAFLQVMVTGLCALTHGALPGMVERRFGRIVNVASVAGLVPASPGQTLYGAAKAFVIKFSQSLNVEYRTRGVHVTALCPGLTYSEFHDVSGTREQVAEAPPWVWMGPDEVAEAGYEAVEANRAVSVPGAPNKALAAAAKLLPDEWGLAVIAHERGRFGLR